MFGKNLFKSSTLFSSNKLVINLSYSSSVEKKIYTANIANERAFVNSFQR